ncbi:MAG: hypothetical protein LUF68_04100, partial [Clostridiales bacterium]|nr:hypothetical protein [Clostridiales bacterium]
QMRKVSCDPLLLCVADPARARAKKTVDASFPDFPFHSANSAIYYCYSIGIFAVVKPHLTEIT